MDLHGPAAEISLQLPIRRRRQRQAGGLLGQAALLRGDPAAGPLEVTDLHSLQEAEEIKAGGGTVGHKFDSTGSRFWVPKTVFGVYVVDTQNPREGATMDDIDKGGRPAIGPKIPINFPEDQLAQVDELARDAGITRAAWIRQAVADAINREASAMNLRITVADVRELLASGSEQPVLYVNTEDGPAKIDVWAGAYVQHYWRIATRDEIEEMIGDEPTDSDIRGILGELQETANEIAL